MYIETHFNQKKELKMNTSTKTATFTIFKNDPNVKSFSAGQTIFEEGKIGEEMYFIKEGEVDIVIQDRVINAHTSGEVFGEMALIDTKIRSASAIAKADCQLVPINERRFIFLVQEHPHFALNIMRVLAERLRLRTES